MKLANGFLTHSTKGEHFIISAGETDFSGIVKNNSTAAFIAECLTKDTTESEIVDRIMAEYSGVTREVAEKDVAGVNDKLRSIGAIED